MNRTNLSIINTHLKVDDIFGCWYYFNKKVYPVINNGVQIDTWKEDTRYYIISHKVSKEKILNKFCGVAFNNTVKEIFDDKNSYHIERMYAPFLLFKDKMTTINSDIQAIENNNISGFIDIPNVSPKELTDPSQYSERFLSTNISFHEMQIIANQNGTELNETNSTFIIFMPIWKLSFSINGIKQQCLFLEKNNELISNICSLPLDEKLKKPINYKPIISSNEDVLKKNILQEDSNKDDIQECTIPVSLFTALLPFFSLFISIIFIYQNIIAKGIEHGTKTYTIVGNTALYLVLAMLVFYLTNYVGIVIDWVIFSLLNLIRYIKWNLYCKKSKHYKQNALRNLQNYFTSIH